MFKTTLVFEGVEKEVILDENMKEKFLSFPCAWYIKEINGKLYVMSSATSKGKTHSIFLHQLVLACEKDEKVLFYNHNTLDNRLHNLRLIKHLPNRVVKG